MPTLRRARRRWQTSSAEIAGETKTLILIASHYDTKYYKDMYFVGANDPAASVATLLEIGRVLGSMQRKTEGDLPACVL